MKSSGQPDDDIGHVHEAPKDCELTDRASMADKQIRRLGTIQIACEYMEAEAARVEHVLSPINLLSEPYDLNCRNWIRQKKWYSVPLPTCGAVLLTILPARREAMCPWRFDYR